MNTEPSNPPQAPRSTGAPAVVLILGMLVVALGAFVVLQSVENLNLRTHPDRVAAEAASPANPEKADQLATAPAPDMLMHSDKTVEEPKVIVQATEKPAPRPEVVVNVTKPHIPTTAQPVTVAVTNAFGGVTMKKTFATLLGSNSQPLARNAEFVRALGRRLIFKVPGIPPMTVDVDQVHPDVLHYLAIDGDAAKREQSEIDTAKIAFAENAEKARQERIKVERERIEAARKAEQAGMNGLTGDQLVTLAALRAAESANSTPAPQVIIIQQQPQPVWSYPVIWTPVNYSYPRSSNFRFNDPGVQYPSEPSIPSSSTFQFIQQRESRDPFAHGRRL